MKMKKFTSLALLLVIVLAAGCRPDNQATLQERLGQILPATAMPTWTAQPTRTQAPATTVPTAVATQVPTATSVEGGALDDLWQEFFQRFESTTRSEAVSESFILPEGDLVAQGEDFQVIFISDVPAQEGLEVPIWTGVYSENSRTGTEEEDRFALRGELFMAVGTISEQTGVFMVITPDRSERFLEIWDGELIPAVPETTQEQVWTDVQMLAGFVAASKGLEEFPLFLVVFDAG